jgi:hypothetical protein
MPRGSFWHLEGFGFGLGPFAQSLGTGADALWSCEEQPPWSADETVKLHLHPLLNNDGDGCNDHWDNPE